MTRRPIISLKTSLIAAAFLAAYVLACFMILEQAAAHDAPTGWSYDISCCSGLDCYQAPPSDVKETPAGYKLSTGELIPYGDRRIHRSRDEFYHECKPAGDAHQMHSFCLYVPDRGF